MFLTNLHTKFSCPLWWQAGAGGKYCTSTCGKILLSFFISHHEHYNTQTITSAYCSNQHLVKSGCKIKLPQFWIQYCNPKDIRIKMEHSGFWSCFFSPLNAQNCFCSKIIVCPDYNDKSSWLTLSKMSLIFSALSFHIRSHFSICHNFQPFFQKIRVIQIRYSFCFV